MIISIKKENTGERIDKFLTKNLDKFSRSKIQKLIKENNILVNDKKINSHYTLKVNDIIKIKQENSKNKAEKRNRILKKFDIKIIKDTKNYLIINKPAGLIVHMATHIKEPTLADYLLKIYPEIKNVGEDTLRPGIVHRLDKEASGLMIVAKNQEFFLNLKKQFQQRKVYKQYTALVYGALTANYGIINFPIKRSTKGHKMAALPQNKIKDQGIREAISEFEVIKKFINYTLLKIKIKTGRTHQIRVHMAALGYPIVGDNLYSTKKTREKNKKINLEQIFLVATKLKFNDLDEKRIEYKVELPEKLKILLSKVK